MNTNIKITRKTLGEIAEKRGLLADFSHGRGQFYKRFPDGTSKFGSLVFFKKISDFTFDQWVQIADIAMKKINSQIVFKLTVDVNGASHLKLTKE